MRTDREKCFVILYDMDQPFSVCLQTLSVVAVLRSYKRNQLNGRVRMRERQFILNQSEHLLMRLSASWDFL